MGLGGVEIAIIVVIVLLVFGPMLIPKLGRQIGGLWRATRELKDTLPTADDLKSDHSSKTEKDK